MTEVCECLWLCVGHHVHALIWLQLSDSMAGNSRHQTRFHLYLLKCDSIMGMTSFILLQSSNVCELRGRRLFTGSGPTIMLTSVCALVSKLVTSKARMAASWDLTHAEGSATGSRDERPHSGHAVCPDTRYIISGKADSPISALQLWVADGEWFLLKEVEVRRFYLIGSLVDSSLSSLLTNSRNSSVVGWAISFVSSTIR